MTSYDVLALGGGTGGLSVARAANRAGARAALISDSPLGGDCTFTGCVPSKTLIESGRAGLSFEAAMARMHEVVERIAATENAETLRGEGIDVFEGRGVFSDAQTVDVEGTAVTAEHVVICTGARAFVPPVDGLGDVDFLTNHELFNLSRKPASLGILGGGPIGCEMAQAFHALGVSVTVFEMADRILSREDPEASRIVAEQMISEGIDLRLSARVTRVESARAGSGIAVHVEGDSPVVVEQLLVAVGRRANTASLGLDTVGVKLDGRGFIETTPELATTTEGIWAVGDVNGRSPFTHAADEMGRIAVGNALKKGRGSGKKFRSDWIPRVTFTNPEVASVGVSEADAPSGARVAELPMHANDRALTAGQTEGYIKLIVGPRRLLGNRGGGQVLGASIVGQRAGEMIHEPTLAMRTRMFAGRLAQTVHAYPSWSSGVQKTAALLFVDEVEGHRARPVRSTK